MKQLMNRKRRLVILFAMDLALAGLFFSGKYKEAPWREESMSVDSTAMNSIHEDMDRQTEIYKEGVKIALTFDDGPHPKYTEQLLDGLKERGIKVTFFVTGAHAELHPDIIKRISEEGHLIGNHTYNHIQLQKNNRELYKQEIVKTNEIIENITGQDVIYIRPPYGVWDKKFESELNMFPVLWTVDPLDWSSVNAASIANKVTSKVKENDIILMHDYYESTVEAALIVVDELIKEGYDFVTVDELMFN